MRRQKPPLVKPVKQPHPPKLKAVRRQNVLLKPVPHQPALNKLVPKQPPLRRKPPKKVRKPPLRVKQLVLKNFDKPAQLQLADRTSPYPNNKLEVVEPRLKTRNRPLKPRQLNVRQRKVKFVMDALPVEVKKYVKFDKPQVNARVHAKLRVPL